jgi:hypothetical protein
VIPARLAIAAYGIGQMSDGMVTTFGIGRGDFREANRLLAWAEQKPVAMSLTKGAIAAGTVYLLIKAHRRHPKAAFWTGLALASVQAYVTARNAKLLR